jgi:hypothetical protein
LSDILFKVNIRSSLDFQETCLWTGSLVIKSMTVAIFPANCPWGKSSRLLSLQNNAESVAALYYPYAGKLKNP